MGEMVFVIRRMRRVVWALMIVYTFGSFIYRCIWNPRSRKQYSRKHRHQSQLRGTQTGPPAHASPGSKLQHVRRNAIMQKRKKKRNLPLGQRSLAEFNAAVQSGSFEMQ